MELKGTVLNVVDFGAFVDIGLKDSGLVHISQMANRYIKSPYDVVAVSDVVKVWVLTVDKERHRVSLTMIQPGSERKPPERREARPPREARAPRVVGPMARPASKERPAKAAVKGSGVRRRVVARAARPRRSCGQIASTHGKAAGHDVRERRGSRGERQRSAAHGAASAGAKAAPRAAQAEIIASRPGRQSAAAHLRRVERFIRRQKRAREKKSADRRSGPRARGRGSRPAPAEAVPAAADTSPAGANPGEATS